MKLVGARSAGFRSYETRTSFRFGSLTVLLETKELGESSALDAVAVLYDEKAARHAADPVFLANGNRNVPPERDVEPAILSPAELESSIQLGARAMQPHGGPLGPKRSSHVK